MADGEAGVPYYVDDPAMLRVREVHQALTEPYDGEQRWQSYTGACSAGDWSGGPLDSSALMEAWDEHMKALQRAVHGK